MMEIDAVGAIAILWLEALLDAALFRVETGAALVGEFHRCCVRTHADMLEQTVVP